MRIGDFATKYSKYLLLAPGLIASIIAVIIPLAILVPISFYKYRFPEVIPEFTLENYIAYLFSEKTGTILLNTFGLSFITCLLCLAFAYPIAYTLVFKIKSSRVKTYIVSLLMVPFLIDWSIRTVAWISVLGERGLVNYFLVSTGLSATPQKLLFSPIALVVIWLQTYTLFMLFPIYLAMQRIDLDYIRAAQVLRTPPHRVQYEIVFKLSRPGILTGFIFVFVSTLGDFVTPSLWAGGIQTLGLSIASYAGNYLWTKAAAMSSIMLVITLVALYILIKIGQIKKLVYER
ncbi:MAG: ABC transporter permease [Candidatus Bathyarchaeia archaeon]